MKRWTLAAIVLAIAMLAALDVYINRLASEVMLLNCLPRPDAHRVAIAMFLHADRNSDRVIQRLNKSGTAVPPDACRF